MLKGIKEFYGFVKREKTRPFVYIVFETENFLIKTASTRKEVKEALKLRYRVFYKEYINKFKFRKLDKDGFDRLADHLIVIDKKSNKIVGTYRIICSLFSDNFYSESEFNISSIKNLKGTKIELGRAAIDKDYRNGQVINLLWKGVARYSLEVEASYIFGCSSVKWENFYYVSELYSYLKSKKFFAENIYVYPYRDYKIELLEDVKFKEDIALKVPPLLQMYLKAGAKLYDYPAFDRFFNVVDFFTLLDASLVNKVFLRRYKK